MKRLSILRKEKGLSQKEFALQLGITQQAISKYENGVREPDYTTLVKIAEFFDVSTDYIIGKSDVRNPYSDSTGEITTIDEAIKFLMTDSTIYGFDGFNINDLSDNEKIQFANDIKEQVKLVGYKYKK